MYKNIILSKIIDYLKFKNWKFDSKGKTPLFVCPFCKSEPASAHLMPHTFTASCFKCQKTYNLVDIYKELEPDTKDLDEEEILELLKQTLNVDVITHKEIEDLDTLLEFYVQNRFDLVPIAKNQKYPVEKEWTVKTHLSKGEWQQWILNGLNIGVKTGQKSSITVLDFDIMEIPEEVRKLLIPTLTQKTNKGVHYFYQFESDLPKTRIDKYSLDIENNGGQVVIAPSSIDGLQRTVDKAPIVKMSKELLDFLKANVTVPRKTQSEILKEEIKDENFKIKPEDFQLTNNGLEGCCNTAFIKLGGILRKELNPIQTSFVLQTLNQHLLEKPMDYKTVRSMVQQLEKYVSYDEQELAHNIVEYLKSTDSASKSEIEIAILGKRATGEDKKRIDKTLVYLIEAEKINKKGRFYKLIKHMEWSDSLIDLGIPISDFQIPYFHDYAYFNKGDLVVIGSQNKYGKTTLAMNFVKRFVDQGVKPYYIYSESGGRFGKTALKLGMKDGDFWRVFCGDPEEMLLEKNAVTIYDWVRPPDFAKTDQLFDHMVQKMEKTQGLLICFVQLKNDNKYFAENMISQYPALACKYMYESEQDGTHTKFEITHVRDPKVQAKQFEIPCQYDWNERTVKMVEEIKSGEE